MRTRLPACVITNGKCSAGGDGEPLPKGLAAGIALAAPGWADTGEGEASGTGGKTVGKNFASVGANLLASSFVGNSIATKTSGTSERAGQVANRSRDDVSISEFFLRKLTIDLNSFPGSASFKIGSTISPAPPVLSSWPRLRTSP